MSEEKKPYFQHSVFVEGPIMSEAGCDPTERTLQTEPHDDHFGTWDDRVFMTGSGLKKGIGISDGCVTHVRPIKGWIDLSEELSKLKERNESRWIEIATRQKEEILKWRSFAEKLFSFFKEYVAMTGGKDRATPEMLELAEKGDKEFGPQ